MRFEISEDMTGGWFWTLSDDRVGALMCSSVRFRTQVQAYADIAAFKAMVSGAGVRVGSKAAAQGGGGGQLGLL